MRYCHHNHVDPLTATRDDMLHFLAWYGERVKQFTVIRRYGSIKFYYAYLIAIGARQDNPCDDIHLKNPPTEMKPPFTLEELQRLLAATHTPRDRALILVLVGTGCRLGEIVGMTLDCIDWEQEMILVEGKGMRQRWVAPGERVMAALRQSMDDSKLVWPSVRGGKALTEQGVYLALRRIGKRAGVVHVHPHRFRTTFACMFDEITDGDVQSLQVLMGHSKVEQTLHYSGWNRTARALDAQRRVGLGDRLAPQQRRLALVE